MHEVWQAQGVHVSFLAAGMVCACCYFESAVRQTGTVWIFIDPSNPPWRDGLLRSYPLSLNPPLQGTTPKGKPFTTPHWDMAGKT